MVDETERPTFTNSEVLEAIADPEFQTELGRFNIETNVSPQLLSGSGLSRMEAQLQQSLNQAEERAASIGSHLVSVGILPTLGEEHLDDKAISSNPRYRLLSEELRRLRGEEFLIEIEGHDHLRMSAESIIPEAACTSTQIHLQVTPGEFAASWNAAQAVAALQVAIGANSPYFVGKRLWAETRIPLFEQAIDSRNAEKRHRGDLVRVWFGHDWIGSAQELFDENLRCFEPILPVLYDDDPLAELDAGLVPTLREMRLHNGTVYRWNRPVYDVTNGVPHLRIENRCLPSGPTVVDTIANAAFYVGLVRAFREDESPVWEQVPFSVARSNFRAAALWGEDAEVFWPEFGQIKATDLIRSHLLARAVDGLRSWGVDEPDIDRLTGVIEGRCAPRATASAWWVDRVDAQTAAGDSQETALRAANADYREHMHANIPVADWDRG